MYRMYLSLGNTLEISINGIWLLNKLNNIQSIDPKLNSKWEQTRLQIHRQMTFDLSEDDKWNIELKEFDSNVINQRVEAHTNTGYDELDRSWLCWSSIENFTAFLLTEIICIYVSLKLYIYI